ncbi:MAG: MFS transporter [Ignavibacteria bacterium]|nr:MFS transporter [Ignavibacteria bacterium]
MVNLDEKKAALLVSTSASFMTPFMASTVNIALPSIGRAFSLDAISLSWVATSYLLAAAMFLVPFGRLADIHGRKRAFISGTILYTLVSLLSAFAPNGVVLILLRGLQGVAAAMIFGTGVAILTSVYPASERGRVLGINVAAVYLGLSIGPFAGGFLTQYAGWRSIFVANAMIGGFIIPFVLGRLRGEWAEARGEPFDIPGSILYSLSLVTVMYGFSILPTMRGVWMISAGILTFAAFVMWELKSSNPLIDISLFRHNVVFAFSNVAALINYSATSAVTFLLSIYLQYIRDLSPQVAGFVLVSQPVMMAAFSPLAGRLSDRIEPRIVASLGMTFIVVGLGLFAYFGGESPLPLVVINLVFLGFGFALFSSPNTNAIMSSVEKRLYGVASATLATMRLTGQMLSMGIVVLILAVTMGRVAITPEHYADFLQSMRAAFIIFTALCGLGIFASLARGKVRTNV